MEALNAVRRQIVEDIIPDGQQALTRFVDNRGRRLSTSDVTNLVIDRLDDLTVSGKFPTPPNPIDALNSLLEEGKNIFLSTPELETPDYKVSALIQ